MYRRIYYTLYKLNNFITGMCVCMHACIYECPYVCMMMRFFLHCPGPECWLLSRLVVPPPQSDHWKQLISEESSHTIIRHKKGHNNIIRTNTVGQNVSQIQGIQLVCYVWMCV